jgi:signal transduction histidine kinase
MMIASFRLQQTLGECCESGLRSLETQIEAAKRQLRSILKGLQPVEVDGHGLAVALEELAGQVRQTHGVECRFASPARPSLDDSFVATQLFLIAREAVHNAVKHARPSCILIGLEEEAGLVLTVRDDGAGLPADVRGTGGMGLRIMEYRAALIGGALRLAALPGGGTLTECSLPKAGPVSYNAGRAADQDRQTKATGSPP